MGKPWKKIKKATKKAVKWVGDTISDAADWVVDEIIEPVVDAVDDVIQAVADDPLKAIATAVAAVYAPWAIPLVEGASVAVKGGDIGDILEATAKSYVAGQVGAYAGKYAASAAVSAGANEAAATIIGSASGQAAVAAATGQDPVQAFLSGGIQAGVNAGLGYIDSQISDTGTGTGTGTGAGAVAETKGFLEQNPTVKNVISASLTAALSGKEITGDVIMGAVLKGKITTEAVQSYLDTDNSLNEAQLAALTSTIQNVTNATFSGADVSDTLYASINAYGKQELNKIIDKNVKNTIDKVTGDYQKLEAQAQKITDADARYKQNADSYNGYVNTLQGKIDVRNGLKAEVDAAREAMKAASGQPDSVYGPLVDAYNAKAKAYNAAVTDSDNYYTQNFTGDGAAAKLKNSLDTDAKALQTLTDEYQTFKDTLVSSAEQLDDVLAPVADATQKAYVRAMTGDEFNAAEYKNVNGLSNLSDEEARYHWLTTGKEEDLPVNAAQYGQDVDNALASSMNGTLEALGLSITDLTPAQIKSLREQTLAYGEGNLQSLRDIKNGSAAIATTFRDNIGKDAAEKLLPEGQLQSTLEYYGVSSYDELPDDKKTEYTNAVLKGQKNLQQINKSAGVSDFDILTGKAGVSTNAEGLMNWEDVSLKFNIPKWDSRYGTVVKKVLHPDGQGEATVDMQGNYLNIDPNTGRPRGEISIPLYSPLSSIKETNPGSYLDTLADMAPEAVKEAAQAGVAGLQQQYEFAKNVATYLANTETAQSIANSDFGKNTAGVVLDAGGELLDSFNNLVLLAGINPESTPLGKTAKNLIAMAGDIKTDDYKAAAEEIQKTIGNANFNEDGTLKTNPDGTPLSTWAKSWNTIKAIGGAAMANPGTFASEYIAKELLQEIPILLASGGTANVVKAGLKQAGEEFAQKMGQRAALGTAGVLDVSESFGGTAGGAYDDAYATALKSGMSDVEAQEYALDKAITAGTIAAVTTIGTMGIGGNDFEKAIFNGKRGKSFSEAFDTVAKEAAQETVEEGLPQAYLESQLYQLDPTRDVVGNVVSNSVLGALSGGSTAGSIYGGAATGDVISNALIMFNPDVRAAVKNEDGLDAAGVTQRLNDLGISDNTIQSNILDRVFDSNYTSTGEAAQAAYDYATKNNIPYKFTKDELTSFTGAKPDANLESAIDSYIDPRYFDVNEAIAAAAAEGITLTPQQAQQYAKQADEAETTAAVRAELDPTYTTNQEAQDMFGKYQFPATQAELDQYIGQSEADAAANIASYTDPYMADAKEVRQMFLDLGYTPTDDEVTRNVALGRRDTNIEEGTLQAVKNYVGNKSVTEIEARNLFGQLGYQPTDDEVNQFVGAGIDFDKSGTLQKIKDYVDPRQVTEAELKAIAEQEGYEYDPDFASQFLGQKDQASTLASAQQAFDEIATNKDEAAQFFQDLGFTPSDEQLNQFVGSTTEAEQQAAIADFVNPLYTNAKEAEKLLRDLGYDPSPEEIAQFTGQVAEADQKGFVSDYVTPRMVTEKEALDALAAQGITNPRPEDVQALIGQYDQELLGGKLDEALPGIRYNSIADLIGKPVQQVTETDVDFVADIIAQQEALSDPSQFVYTDAQLQYDVTGDGIVDINDQNLLNNAIQGQDVTFAQDSVFAQPATGIYAAIDQQAQQAQQAQTQMQQQLAQQVEDEATKTRRLGNLKDFQEMLIQDAGRMTQVKSQPVAKIGPAYDFQSIFANPAQEAFYRTPYARGGVVETNDELLKLLGGN